MLEKFKKETQDKLNELMTAKGLGKKKASEAAKEGTMAFLHSIKDLEPDQLSNLFSKWKKDAKKKKGGDIQKIFKDVKGNFDHFIASGETVVKKAKLKSSFHNIVADVESAYNGLEREVKKKRTEHEVKHMISDAQDKISDVFTHKGMSIDKAKKEAKKTINDVVSGLERKFDSAKKDSKKDKAKLEAVDMLAKFKGKVHEVLASATGNKKNAGIDFKNTANSLVSVFEQKINSFQKDTKTNKDEKQIKAVENSLNTKFSHILANKGMSFDKAEKEAKSTIAKLMTDLSKNIDSKSVIKKGMNYAILASMLNKDLHSLFGKGDKAASNNKA